MSKRKKIWWLSLEHCEVARLAIGPAYSASLKKEYPHDCYVVALVAPGGLVGIVVGALVLTEGLARRLSSALGARHETPPEGPATGTACLFQYCEFPVASCANR